jgi:hypothetical protein
MAISACLSDIDHGLVPLLPVNTPQACPGISRDVLRHCALKLTTLSDPVSSRSTFPPVPHSAPKTSLPALCPPTLLFNTSSCLLNSLFCSSTLLALVRSARTSDSSAWMYVSLRSLCVLMPSQYISKLGNKARDHAIPLCTPHLLPALEVRSARLVDVFG